MNLYVGNLPFKMTDDELHDLFMQYGHVKSAKIIKDRMTKRSRGFGFVEMVDEEAGKQARAVLHESSHQGRRIIVDEAQPRKTG